MTFILARTPLRLIPSEGTGETPEQPATVKIMVDKIIQDFTAVPMGDEKNKAGATYELFVRTALGQCCRYVLVEHSGKVYPQSLITLPYSNLSPEEVIPLILG